MAKPNNDTLYLSRLRDYYAENQRIPSLKRIADLMGFSSRAASSKLLDRLESAGFIQRTPDGEAWVPVDRVFERPFIRSSERLMENDDQLMLKRIRGRPRLGSKSAVIERLVDATEKLLRDYNHFNLTEQRIAVAAGVDKRMIHYYFGDKDGLLFEVIARRGDEVVKKWEELDAIDPASPHVTRQIVKIMADAHYAKPWIERTMAVEAGLRGSVINKKFMQRFGPHEIGPLPLRRVIRRLIECGVYDSCNDAEQVATSIYFMILAPLTLAPFSGDPSTALDKYKTDSWIDHVSELFDRQLRATEVKDIPSSN